jgi:hypothetical protein
MNEWRKGFRREGRNAERKEYTSKKEGRKEGRKKAGRKEGIQEGRMERGKRYVCMQHILSIQTIIYLLW